MQGIKKRIVPGRTEDRQLVSALIGYSLYLLVLILTACSSQLVPERSDLSYQFGPDTGLAYDYYFEPDSLRIFLKVTDNTAIGYLQKPDTHLSYLVSKGYDRKSIYLRDSVLYINKKITDLPDKTAMVVLAVPAARISYPSVLTLIVPQLSAVQEVALVDILLTESSKSRGLVLLDSTGRAPLFQHFINTSQTVRIRAGTADTLVTVRRFPANFTPAIPPMSGKNSVPAATLKVESKQVFSLANSLAFTQPGIYLLENRSGRTALLVEEGAFPRLTSARELIEPLLYLTGSDERRSLYDAPEPKLAVDAFWLTIARQDKNLGKQLIREFYGRVEKANRYFSSHKAGWLTDRGMIYIVFGSPAYITRSWDREEWRYTQNVTARDEVKFIFIKKPNTFTENHYELVRDAAYEYVWYNQVDKWRKGIIGIPVPAPGPSGKRNRTK